MWTRGRVFTHESGTLNTFHKLRLDERKAGGLSAKFFSSVITLFYVLLSMFVVIYTLEN